MAKLFFYACAVVSSILLVTESAYDPESFVVNTVYLAVTYVDQEYTVDVKLYISNQIDSLTKPQKLQVTAQTKSVISNSPSPEERLIAYYILHNLKPDDYPIPAASNWFEDQISQIDFPNQQKWEEFVNVDDIGF
uniref:uncharacterized protein LOC120346421 n=1 Tax=Styela clava TaxID=7725 RepID=UPI001939665E|nr:uncharacterized protein LOC120346421 [Styela clava]